MAFTVIPAKVQPPTMPTGAWEVNTQCEQATNLVGFLDIERRRFWWRGRWVPMNVLGTSRTTALSLPGIGGTAILGDTNNGCIFTATGALTPGIGTTTPFTVHCWASSLHSDTVDKFLWGAVGGANTDRMTIGDGGTPANLFKASAKTTGANTFSNRNSVVVPQANVVYALTMIDRVDTFPDIFVNGIQNNGTTSQDNGGTRPAIIDTFTFGASGITGANPLIGSLAYGGVWEAKLSDTFIYSLWDPRTRWDLMWQQKKLYFDISPPADQDVPPSQYARPKYITLNEFSPQARGLVAWLPSVDGTLVRAVVPGKSIVYSFGDVSNQPSTVVQRSDWIGQDPRPLPPVSQPSDFGMVPRTFKDMSPAPGNVRSVYLLDTLTDVSGLTDATFVYWIFPLAQPFTDAAYWTQFEGTNDGMTNQGITFSGTPTQSLTFTSDPHRRGRWQMITVARTLAGITIWRDLEIVQSGLSAGDVLPTLSGETYMLIGGINDSSSSGANGVNALWADFRVYNRAWTQVDVEYAFKPETRWDYYLQLGVKPWELPLAPPPVITGFAGTMIGDWGGSSVFAE